MAIFSKNAKYPILGSFLLKFGKNKFSTKIRLHHYLASTVPEHHPNNQKKMNEVILRKTNKQINKHR